MSARVRVPSLKLRIGGAGSDVDMPRRKKRREGAEEAEHVSVTETVRRKMQQVVVEQRTSARTRVPSLKVRIGAGSGVRTSASFNVDMPSPTRIVEGAEEDVEEEEEV